MNRKQTLQECFQSSPRKSIKAKGYFDVYEKLLKKYRGKDITLVEVGVLDGGSLHMWRAYFGPKARIIGVEYNADAEKLANDGFEIYIGNQADPKFWQEFFQQVGTVDVLIDDGGHWNDQQIITVVSTLSHIKDEGFLIIEDTHCSYYAWMGNPSRYSFVSYVKKLVDVINSRWEPLYDNYSHDAKNCVYGIYFFESIVALEINRSLCDVNKPITNSSTPVISRAYGTETTGMHVYLDRLGLEKFKGVLNFLTPLLRKLIAFIYLKLMHNIANLKLRKYFP